MAQKSVRDNTEKPAPNPSEAMAGLLGTLERLGGADGAVASMEASERRSRLINLKLTLLLEDRGIDWKNDPRIQDLKKT